MTELRYEPFVYERDIQACEQLSLREADTTTIKCFDFKSVCAAVHHNLITSHKSWTILNQDNQVYGIAGVAYVGCAGTPWMFAEERIKEDTKGFFAGSHKMIAEMLEDVDYLYNYVWEKHDYSIRWLKKLGFTFRYDEVLEVGGENFIYYDKGTAL